MTMSDEQRQAALRAAEAVRYYLLQPHPRLNSEELRLVLLPRLLCATEGMPEQKAARYIKRQAFKPIYPGKTQHLRELAAGLVERLEGGSDEDQTDA
jgi:hypothetical protein